MPEDLEYYPPISDLITIEDWPESFNFLTDEIQQVLDNLYYNAHIKSKSVDGTSAFHSLDIVSKQKLAFEIAGTGIFFVLNPDYVDSAVSSFPITIYWKWQILRVINQPVVGVITAPLQKTLSAAQRGVLTKLYFPRPLSACGERAGGRSLAGVS